jgi:hypothetical protein
VRPLERVGFYLIVEEFKTPWGWWTLGRLLVPLFLLEKCAFECVVVSLYVANLCSTAAAPVLIPYDLANLVRRYQEYFSKSLDTQMLRSAPGITAIITGTSGNRGVLLFRSTRRSFVRLLQRPSRNHFMTSSLNRKMQVWKLFGHEGRGSRCCHRA